MDRLDTINSYFNQKERARLNELVQNTGGLPTMSKDEIRLSCIENDGYESPELNEKLYLHFRGFKRIENLEEYTACKALWLDSNGFELIENLGHMPLRCLYLSKNLITTIQGLENLSNLVTLDLSNNRISNIDGLQGCKCLKTINLQRNALATAESLEGLIVCPSIDNIDVTNNRIEGDVISVFSKLPALHALSVNGNPCTQTQGFRKRTIAAIPTLSYLDRPIDEIEKVGAHAFVTEGPEKEQEVRLAFIANQKQQRSDELAQFRTWQREQLALRKEKIASGNTEGISLITEFTPEEKAEREAEAQKAADMEKEMLDMGIGKLGQKYWQMQGRSDCRDDGIDGLEAAVQELKSTKERQRQVEEEFLRDQEAGIVDADDVRVELLDDEEEEEHLHQNQAKGSINDIDEDIDVEFQKVQIEADDEDDDDDEDDKVEESDSEENVISEDDEIEQHSPAKDNGRAEEVFDDANEEPKWVHQQRVQESIEIYERQQRMEKLKKEQAAKGLSVDDVVNPPIDSFSTTRTTIDWSFEKNNSPSDDDGGKVYWTEWMDLKLAELVQSCVYDFNSIANSFTELAESSEFSQLPPMAFGVGKHSKEILESLSEEDCRLRWAELDAKQWCTDDDGANDSLVEGGVPAVYKICVQPDVLGKGHGAQPTFAAMTNMANGIPSYLKVPTAFPSVSDDEDDENDDDDVISSKFERFEALD